MGHTVIVTHTDLDGVASAAVYLKVAGLRPGEATIIYAEPYNLDEKLEALEANLDRGDRIAIMDLGLNRSTMEGIIKVLQSLLRRGVEVEWYDHHVWSNDQIKAVSGVGVTLFVDKSTCATGVVARYASKLYDSSVDGMEDLVRAVCAADLWRWDHHLAPKLFRIIGRRNDDKWKNSIIEKFYNGVIWDDEMEEKLQDYINRELAGYSRILRTTAKARAGGCTVVAAAKPEGPPSTSMVGALLLSRYKADIAVIIRVNGAMSLRSRRVDVSRIATGLGGGGHATAAGAKPPMPVYIKILSFLTLKVLSWHAARLVAKTTMEVGACRELAGGAALA